MSFEVFKTLIDRICLDHRKIEKQRSPISVVFHGGEPLLIGAAWFRLFLAYARTQFLRNQVEYSFSIQTNLTLLTPELLRLFQEYHVTIGCSFDGGAAGSNKSRTLANPEFFIQKMREAEKYGVTIGTLAVLSQQNQHFTRQNIKFLIKHGISTGKWNYAEDLFHVGNVEIPGEEYFKNVVLPLFEALGNPNPRKRFSESNLKNTCLRFIKDQFLLNQEPTHQNIEGNCYIKFCGGGSRVLEISPDGSVNSCGRYSADTETSKVFSLDTPDFLGVVTRQTFYQKTLVKHRLLLENHCDLCPAADVCDYGCLAFALEKNDHKPFIDSKLVCDYYRLLAQFLRDNFLLVFDKVFNEESHYTDHWYLPVHYAVTRRTIATLQEQLPRALFKKYSIQPDKQFKSSDNKCYQLDIQRIKK